MKEGVIDGQAVLRDLRKVEQATGMPLVPDRYGYDPANEMPLLEAFSKLARAHAWGNVRTGVLPAKTARWMDMLIATQAGMLRKSNALIHSDLARAGQFKEALAKGEVPAELERLLGESIGIGREPVGEGPEVTDSRVADLKGTEVNATFSVDPTESSPRVVARETNRDQPEIEDVHQYREDSKEHTEELSETHNKYIKEAVYRMSLKKIPALRGTPEREWEVASTGGYNVVIEGGGATYKADDVVGSTVVEAKHVSKPEISPFVNVSSIPERIREKIRTEKIEPGFARMAAVIKDPSNPLSDVEIVVNHPDAAPYFIDLIKKFGLNGRVVVR